MTRHIPDQSVLWCDNLKLNGSQSHLEIGEVTSSLFLFSAMSHTEVVFCSNNSSCFSKKKNTIKAVLQKTKKKTQARVLSVKRMAGVTQLSSH